VECLGACVNAPMVQINKDFFEDLTADSFNEILEAFARGEEPRPGPQNGRQFSAPRSGPTTLTDPAVCAPRAGQSAGAAEAGNKSGETE
jgi:NADH-quinone oxidoreductase subunit E